MSEKARYTFLRWNGKYGETAQFVVRDNKTGKQSLFTPGRLNDLVWVNQDLSQSPHYKGWEDFQNEAVEDLDDVVF